MKLTPMLQQYLDAKDQYPDAVLFFRMGDFYEMFFEDAVVVSKELGLTLTARNKGDEDEVPMAGVPHHAARGYVNRLIEKGFTVAICEQLEDPATVKGIVKRDVVRVVTPGVVFDADSLDATTPNFVAAVFATSAADAFGVAYLDVSTGEFRATEVLSAHDVGNEVRRFEPREVLVNEVVQAALERAHVGLGEAFVRVRPDGFFEQKRLLADVARGVRLAADIDRDGYFLDERALAQRCEGLATFEFGAAVAVLSAATGVLRYIVDTQRGVPSHLRAVEPYHARSFLIIDEATKANLELTETLMGGRRAGSLLSIIDRTVSAMGGRLLRNWLSYPLVDVPAINARLDAVSEFVGRPALRDDVRAALDGVYDLERLCGKISGGSANGRDLRSLLSTLDAVEPIRALLEDCETPRLGWLAESLDPYDDLRHLIDSAIVEEPPTSITDGGLFKRGFDEELDEILELTGDGKDWLLRYELDEKRRTDISSLKVRHNKVFGYYIEVTRSNLDLVPDDYIRKQTLANAERFFTPQLKEMEEKILGAEDRRRMLEQKLFEDLRRTIGAQIPRLLGTARLLAEVDVLAAFAELAVRHDYVRPDVADDELLAIEDGRHPVVERTMNEERFVPNSVCLDTGERRLQVITGPNMAGKSTVIRQVALITLMAQMGCFVPASSAHVGVVDKIFSRVGASDNLARGQSTFMVEMTETAHILHNATKKSLVILDEIGRGTSTFDGLSIAWAVAEHLHDKIGAKTMFATHYHELTELRRTLEGMETLSIAVKEWQDDIIFLRKLVKGEANRSYGVQVARLAGLPEPVLARAREVLQNLEAGQFDERGLPIGSKGRPARPTTHHNPNQLSLFAAGARLSDGAQTALDALRELQPDALTPLEALNVLSRLVQQIKE